MLSFSLVAEALKGLIYLRPSGENFLFAIQQFHKRKNLLEINVHFNHPDSEFILVSKDLGCEAFVLSAKQIEYCREM